MHGQIHLIAVNPLSSGISLISLVLSLLTNDAKNKIQRGSPPSGSLSDSAIPGGPWVTDIKEFWEAPWVPSVLCEAIRLWGSRYKHSCQSTYSSDESEVASLVGLGFAHSWKAVCLALG